MPKWVAGGCRWANNFSAAVWAVETGLHGAIPVYLFALDGIARWRLLERKRSPAIREVTPTESPIPHLQQTRSESLPAAELPPSWPIFDPSQYWPTQASLDFLPGLTSIACRANTSSAVLSPPSHKCLFTPSRRQRLPCQPLYDHPLSIFCLIRPRLRNSRAARG
ncbi:hypothetical protein EDB83DRAFT_589497 [Lactarius deliciosus]|nr:hypothetical protein EDB83DRAFT_589497 [Lactarius deliciosus]